MLFIYLFSSLEFSRKGVSSSSNAVKYGGKTGSVYEGYYGGRQPSKGDEDYTPAASAGIEIRSDPAKKFKDRLYYGFGDKFRNERAKLKVVCIKRAALKGRNCTCTLQF